MWYLIRKTDWKPIKKYRSYLEKVAAINILRVLSLHAPGFRKIRSLFDPCLSKFILSEIGRKNFQCKGWIYGRHYIWIRWWTAIEIVLFTSGKKIGNCKLSMLYNKKFGWHLAFDPTKIICLFSFYYRWIKFTSKWGQVINFSWIWKSVEKCDFQRRTRWRIFKIIIDGIDHLEWSLFGHFIKKEFQWEKSLYKNLERRL